MHRFRPSIKLNWVLWDTTNLMRCGSAVMLARTGRRPRRFSASISCTPSPRKACRKKSRRIAAGGMGSVGVAVGPLLGGAAVATLGWRVIFLVNVPVGVLTLTIAKRAEAKPRKIAIKK